MTFAEPQTVEEMKARYRAAKAALWPTQKPRFAAFGIGDISVSEQKPKPNKNKRVLESRAAIPDKGRRDLDNILVTVAYVTGRHMDEIKGKGRSKFIMPARLMFYYLAKTHGKASSNEIARFCGGRNHATILSGIDSAKARLERCEVKFSTDLMKCLDILGEAK